LTHLLQRLFTELEPGNMHLLQRLFTELELFTEGRLVCETHRLMQRLAGSGVVVIIDGLDQLESSSRLKWLPELLPPGVRCIISVTVDPERAHREANQRWCAEQEAAAMGKRCCAKAWLYGVEPLRGEQMWRAWLFVPKTRLALSCKKITLGVYQTKEEAAAAYDKAARDYYGRDVKCNFNSATASTSGSASINGLPACMTIVPRGLAHTYEILRQRSQSILVDPLSHEEANEAMANRHVQLEGLGKTEAERLMLSILTPTLCGESWGYDQQGEATPKSRHLQGAAEAGCKGLLLLQQVQELVNRLLERVRARRQAIEQEVEDLRIMLAALEEVHEDGSMLLESTEERAEIREGLLLQLLEIERSCNADNLLWLVTVCKEIIAGAEEHGREDDISSILHYTDEEHGREDRTAGADIRTDIMTVLHQAIDSFAFDLRSLLHQVMERLERKHGQPFVRAALCILAASRAGLLYAELHSILTPEIEAMGADRDQRWPALCEDLQRIGIVRHDAGTSGTSGAQGGLMCFAHRTIGSSVRLKYIGWGWGRMGEAYIGWGWGRMSEAAIVRGSVCDMDTKQAAALKPWHQRLAEYFETAPDVSRRAAELPFQLARSLEMQSNISDCPRNHAKLQRRLLCALVEWTTFEYLVCGISTITGTTGTSTDTRTCTSTTSGGTTDSVVASSFLSSDLLRFSRAAGGYKAMGAALRASIESYPAENPHIESAQAELCRRTSIAASFLTDSGEYNHAIEMLHHALTSGSSSGGGSAKADRATIGRTPGSSAPNGTACRTGRATAGVSVEFGDGAVATTELIRARMLWQYADAMAKREDAITYFTNRDVRNYRKARDAYKSAAELFERALQLQQPQYGQSQRWQQQWNAYRAALALCRTGSAHACSWIVTIHQAGDHDGGGTCGVVYTETYSPLASSPLARLLVASSSSWSMLVEEEIAARGAIVALHELQHPLQATSMTHLAEVYMSAYRILRRQGAVAVSEASQTAPGSAREVALRWASLTMATARLCLGQYREAIETFEELDAEFNRLAYLQCMWSLTIVYDDHGLAAEQEPWLQRVMCGYEALLGKEHPLSRMARQDLATCCLWPMGRGTEALAVENGDPPKKVRGDAGRGPAWLTASQSCLNAQKKRWWPATN
jgi:tetratricopeptide (TPR) repeat protein